MAQTHSTEVIAIRVRQVRRRKGWTAERLGEEMAKVGLPWNRSVMANLESGRRRYVTVDELLALAYVLDVAPIHLLVPIDDEAAPYAVLPQRSEPAGVVRSWVRGLAQLPGQDGRVYSSEVPKDEWKLGGLTEDEYRSLFGEDRP